MLYFQREFDEGRRIVLRGRIAYDEANERFRILEGEETHDGSIRAVSGRYYFYKEVSLAAPMIHHTNGAALHT